MFYNILEHVGSIDPSSPLHRPSIDPSMIPSSFLRCSWPTAGTTPAAQNERHAAWERLRSFYGPDGSPRMGQTKTSQTICFKCLAAWLHGCLAWVLGVGVELKSCRMIFCISKNYDSSYKPLVKICCRGICFASFGRV